MGCPRIVRLTAFGHALSNAFLGTLAGLNRREIGQFWIRTLRVEQIDRHVSLLRLLTFDR